jgi:Predicted transcription factor, homolog of eukaryotic MBF1
VSGVQNRNGRLDVPKVRSTGPKEDAFLRELGARIRKIRKAKGLSIPKVYVLNPKLSMSTLSKIENGKIDPQIGTLRKIATALGVKLREIVGED